MKPDDAKIESRIYDEDDYNPMLEFSIEDRCMVRFSVFSFPEEKREWLKEVLERQLKEIYAAGYNDGKKDVRDAYETFLAEMNE